MPKSQRTKIMQNIWDFAICIELFSIQECINRLFFSNSQEPSGILKINLSLMWNCIKITMISFQLTSLICLGSMNLHNTIPHLFCPSILCFLRKMKCWNPLILKTLSFRKQEFLLIFPWMYFLEKQQAFMEIAQ